MLIRITHVTGQGGTIVTMAGRVVEGGRATGPYIAIHWDCQIFSSFVSDNPHLTLPFDAEYDKSKLEVLGEHRRTAAAQIARRRRAAFKRLGLSPGGKEINAAIAALGGHTHA